MLSLYLLQKFFLVLLLLRQYSLYSFISISIFFLIFFLKEDSHDITGYITLASSSGSANFTIFYKNIISFLDSFVEDKRTIIMIYKFLLVCLASSIILFFKEKKFFILSIVLSSVAVMLAVHNNLRQGTASLFILLGIISYLYENKKIGISLIFISLGFHESASFFVVAVFILGVVYKKFVPRNFNKKNNNINIHMYVYASLAAIFSALIIIFNFNLFPYQSYLEMDLASMKVSRVNHEVKMLLMFVFWLLTESFIKFRGIDYDIDFIRYLRQFFLFFALIISFNNSFYEIANRILYFYYILELGLMCYLVDRKIFSLVLLILLCYGFAFNVWSILG